MSSQEQTFKTKDYEINEDLIPNDSQYSSKEFKESKYRFVQLAIFFYQHLVLEISLSGITSIGSQISEVFNISKETIVFSSTLLIIATIISTLFTAYYLEKIGLRNSNILFSVLSLGGCVLKLFTYQSVIFLMLAQFVTGIGNAFVVNGQMLFFQNWFSPKNIKYYFPLIATSVFIGIGTGAILPFIFIDQNEKDEQKFTQQFKNFMYFYIGTNCINFLISILFFKEKTPALKNKKSENQNYDWSKFKQDLIGLLTNKNFLHFCSIIALGRGILLVVFGNFNIYFTELNFSQIESSLILEMFILFGLIGSALYNWKFSQNKNIKNTLIIFTLSGYFKKNFFVEFISYVLLFKLYFSYEIIVQFIRFFFGKQNSNDFYSLYVKY